MLKTLTISGLLAASFTQATAQKMPYPDTIIVLDVSNSMWGQIDGKAKILIARDVVSDLVTNIEEDIDFGLIAYGHRSKSDCGDIETIIPVGTLDPAGFRAKVNSLTPHGRTPLTAAVRQAADDLSYTTRSARIILISDGVESCDGDPVTLASMLAQNALDLTVHVIGFDVSGIEDQSGLEALATQNHGLYLTPDTSKELLDNLNEMMEMPTGSSAENGETMAAPMAEATLSAPESVGPRSRIKVGFTGPMENGAYIGLAEAGSQNLIAIARATTDGQALLIAPRTPGSYELRYFSGDNHLLASQPLQVQ